MIGSIQSNLSLLAAAAVICANCLCVATNFKVTQAITLTTLGYEKPKYWKGNPVQLQFLRDHQLAISFPTRNTSLTLTTRSEGNGGGYLFKTVVIDDETGAIRAEREWGTFEPLSKLMPLEPQAFIVRDSGYLHLFSERLEPIGQWKLPEHAFAELYPSFTGNTLYVALSSRPRQILVLDGKNLKEKGSFFISNWRSTVAAGDDEGFIYKPFEGNGFLKASPGHATITVQPTSLPDCSNSLNFVTASELVVSGGCHDVTLMNTHGGIVRGSGLGKKRLGQVFPLKETDHFCADVRRFAGGSDFFDIAPHVSDNQLVCFDDSTKRSPNSPFRLVVPIPLVGRYPPTAPRPLSWIKKK